MDISKLHPEDSAAIEELWSIWTAKKQHDNPHDPPPTRAGFDSTVADSTPGEHVEWHLARVGGTLVGAMQFGRPLLDNLHLCGVEIGVPPTHRRRGIGSALLAKAVELGRAAGCRTLISYASEPLPGGPHLTTDGRDFLLANGFHIANTMRSRRLDLAAIDAPSEQKLLDDAWRHAEDYELVQWTGATPKEHVGDAAALASRLQTDVPRGSLDLEESHFDADRYTAKENAELARGNDFVCSYVRHAASGALVGHSTVAVHTETPDLGWQWITLVHPDHRGHRLGMIVKIENHRLLRRVKPQTRWIETSNAEANPHMVAINEKLGFAESARHHAFQREI